MQKILRIYISVKQAPFKPLYLPNVSTPPFHPCHWFGPRLFPIGSVCDESMVSFLNPEDCCKFVENKNNFVKHSPIQQVYMNTYGPNEWCGPQNTITHAHRCLLRHNVFVSNFYSHRFTFVKMAQLNHKYGPKCILTRVTSYALWLV